MVSSGDRGVPVVLAPSDPDASSRPGSGSAEHRRYQRQRKPTSGAMDEFTGDEIHSRFSGCIRDVVAGYLLLLAGAELLIRVQEEVSTAAQAHTQ